MFVLNEDLSIWVTRGDVAFFNVTAENENGEAHIFSPGDVVRFKAFAKKNCSGVVLQKDFPVTEETQSVEVLLTEQDTKIGGVISKPTDYWYEVELNPFTNPQTIIGYDNDGAKIFKLFPEGKDLTTDTESWEDIPAVDDAFSLTSERPVQNRIISKKLIDIDFREFGVNAYEIAVANGFEGTVEEWLKSVIFILTEDEKAQMLAPIEESIGTLRGDITAIQENADTIQESVDTIQENMDTMGTDITAIQENMDTVAAGKMDKFGSVTDNGTSTKIAFEKAAGLGYGAGSIVFNDKQVGVSYANAGFGIGKDSSGNSAITFFNLDTSDKKAVLTGVGAPVSDTDAANKAYVEAAAEECRGYCDEGLTAVREDMTDALAGAVFHTSNIFSKTTAGTMTIAAGASTAATIYTKTSSDKVLYIEPMYSINASNGSDAEVHAFRVFAVQDRSDDSGLSYKIFSERGTGEDTTFSMAVFYNIHEIG